MCTAEYRRLRAAPDEMIDGYGATSVAEFFAVVTEVFFTRPVRLRAAKPDLYDVFATFYRQDPAARAGR